MLPTLNKEYIIFDCRDGPYVEIQHIQIDTRGELVAWFILSVEQQFFIADQTLRRWHL